MSDQKTTITLCPMNPPPGLQALADHVDVSIRAEAEAQRRAGFSHSEAVRRAMILHEPARQEVARMVAAWASFQAPKMIVQKESANHE